MGDASPPPGDAQPAAPITETALPEIEAVVAPPAATSNAPAPSPPVAVSVGAPGTTSTVKRSRSDEGDVVHSSKRPRSEKIPAPTQAADIAVEPSKEARGDAETSAKSDAMRVDTGDKQESSAKDKNESEKPATPADDDDDKVSPAKGSVDSTKADAKPSPSKASPTAKGSAADSKATPRAPLVIPEDEKPLDLLAMRQFEFDQVGRFGPSQLKRYEHFRRSDLKKDKVRKVCMALNPSLGKVQDPFIIALKGLAKVFVGDVVESALEVRTQLGDTGALQPKHLREAYRRLRRDGALPGSEPKPGALG